MLLSICLVFHQYQPGVAYKSIAYKKSVHIYFWSEDHQEPCNDDGFLGLAECLEGFEKGGKLSIWLQHLNSLGHSLHTDISKKNGSEKINKLIIAEHGFYV